MHGADTRHNEGKMTIVICTLAIITTFFRIPKFSWILSSGGVNDFSPICDFIRVESMCYLLSAKGSRFYGKVSLDLSSSATNINCFGSISF